MSRIKPSHKNWFERNPKKTFSLVFVLLAVGFLCLAEKILVAKNKTHRSDTVRYIRLKEHAPSEVLYVRPQEVYKPGEVDSLPMREYLFRTDADGFIMPSKIHDRPDIRIVFLGGSTTECMYVDEGSRFPYLAGRLLDQKTGLKVNSYNSGVSGNNSLHSIDILLNKIVPMKPDIAVMMHNINDLTILLYEKTYWNNNPTRSPLVVIDEDASFRHIIREIKDLSFPHVYSALAELVSLRSFKQSEPDEFKHKRGKRVDIDKDHLIREFKMNLQTFINVCEARNITPVLMTQANRVTDKPDAVIEALLARVEQSNGLRRDDLREIFGLFNQAIRDVGARNNILVVDLDKIVPKEKEYMYDEVHLNTRGSQLASGVIAEALQPLVASVHAKKLK